MGSDSNVWHQVHAQREDGVAAMFLIRDVEPRADQPKIFVIELPYPVTDLSGQPDAAAYRRLSAFQEQWLEPACAALGWTFVAWKCEDGSFFLYLYGAGDPDALLEKLAPFDGELGFFNDLDAEWSEYAALRELVEQAESEDEGDDEDDGGGEHDHVHGEDCDHDHDHHDHGHHDHDHDHSHGALASGIPVVEPAGEHTGDAAPPELARRNGKSRSIAADSEATAATHRPLPRAVPARTGRPKRAGSRARAADKRADTATPAAAKRTAAKRTAAKRTATKRPTATAKAKRAAPARPAKRAQAKPAKRTAAARPAKRAAKPRRSR